MEFVPPPQLPTGLAQETLRLAQGANLGSALSKGIDQMAPVIAQAIHDRKNEIPIDQAIALGLVPGSYTKAPGIPLGSKIPEGYTGPKYEVPSSDIFGSALRGATLSSAQKIQTEQAGYSRAMDLQSRKNEGAQAKTIVPINDIDKVNYKAAYGKDMPEGMDKWHTAQQKEVADLAKAKMTATDKAAGKSAKDQLADDKFWMQIERAHDPINAPRGSNLGVIGQNNMAANRAIKILSNPKATYQEISLGMLDLNRIMAGGKPDEQAIKHTSYGTLISDISKWATYFKNTPEAANNPEIRKRILAKVMEIKQIDNQALEDHFRSAEPTLQHVISKNPQRWLDFKNRVMNSNNDVRVTPAQRYEELKGMGVPEGQIYEQLAKEGHK